MCSHHHTEYDQQECHHHSWRLANHVFRMNEIVQSVPLGLSKRVSFQKHISMVRTDTSSARTKKNFPVCESLPDKYSNLNQLEVSFSASTARSAPFSTSI